MTRPMRTLSTIAISILIVGATACSDDDDDTEDALSGVCDAQEQVLSDLAALIALDPATNTTGEYQSALDDLDGDVDQLVDARGDLAEEDVDSVQSTFQEIRDGLDDLDDVPLAEARDDAGQGIVDGAARLQAEYDAAYANSSCSE